MQGSRPAVAAPPTSQIPGLGDHSEAGGRNDATRSAVRDTDSAYVQTAKRGGQRNLLSMDQDMPTDDNGAARRSPAAQLKPDWSYDDSGYRDNLAAESGSPSQAQRGRQQYQGSASQ